MGGRVLQDTDDVASLLSLVGIICVTGSGGLGSHSHLPGPADLLVEGELLDCDGKSDSSPEREPADEDSKGPEGTDGAKKRKRKPYRPGRAPDGRRFLAEAFWVKPIVCVGMGC